MAGGGSFPTTLPGAAHTLMSWRWMHRKTGEQQPWGGSSGSLPPETLFSLSLFPFFFFLFFKRQTPWESPGQSSGSAQAPRSPALCWAPCRWMPHSRVNFYTTARGSDPRALPRAVPRHAGQPPRCTDPAAGGVAQTLSQLGAGEGESPSETFPNPPCATAPLRAELCPPPCANPPGSPSGTPRHRRPLRARGAEQDRGGGRPPRGDRDPRPPAPAARHRVGLVPHSLLLPGVPPPGAPPVRTRPAARPLRPGPAAFFCLVWPEPGRPGRDEGPGTAPVALQHLGPSHRPVPGRAAPPAPQCPAPAQVRLGHRPSGGGRRGAAPPCPRLRAPESFGQPRRGGRDREGIGAALDAAAPTGREAAREGRGGPGRGQPGDGGRGGCRRSPEGRQAGSHSPRGPCPGCPGRGRRGTALSKAPGHCGDLPGLAELQEPIRAA